MVATLKRCTVCDAHKPLDDFHKMAASRDGKAYICKPCARARTNAWRADRPWEKSYRKLCQIYERKYGLTMDDYCAMWTSQGGVCAICGGGQRGRSRQLVVDHCHETGKVRGLLCGPCNSGIGQLGDDANVALAAAAYLVRHSDQPASV